MTLRKLASLLLCSALATTAAACGDDDDGGSSTVDASNNNVADAAPEADVEVDEDATVADFTIRINEVFAAGDAANIVGYKGDWVELMNLGPDTADVSGWRVGDLDDLGGGLPADTFIAPGALLLIQAGPTLTAGLGTGGDTVRLMKATGTDIVDQTTWGANGAGTKGTDPEQTWARTADGTGNFATTTLGGTPNATNVVAAKKH